MPEAKSFESIRDKYVQARSAERKALVERLKASDFTVKWGGHGKTNYKSGTNDLDPVYNLQNHMWIEPTKEDVHFLISLNPYDVDPGSANPHDLYDRIGVQAYLGKNNETSIRTSMIITKWSLPLTEETTEELIGYLDKLVKMFKYGRELFEGKE